MSERAHDLEDLFENAPCGYAVLAADGRIAKANRTLCEWLGHNADQLAGKRPHDLLSMPGRIFYETHIAPLLRMQGYFNEVALDLMSATGDKVSVIANAVEHRDGEGGVSHIRIAFLKAADRRRYEHELLKARDVARQDLQSERDAAELREQFIAVLGHDLRNPLASMSAGTRLLSRESRNDAEARILAMMQTTVFRMAGLIDNILDFARGRLGGGITLDRQPHDLHPALHQVVEELRTATPDRMIEEHYDLRESVSCDRTRICQLASNLVGNALTHGSAREPVRLETRTTGDAFELSVTNGGEPISTASMEKLFQPFFRGQVRASKQGLGLGLYIASEIAKAHDGALEVRSSDTKTCFTFRMPLRAG
jgi:sigma-B regulation protein RsbU (phosphoserine phosphatase)